MQNPDAKAGSETSMRSPDRNSARNRACPLIRNQGQWQPPRTRPSSCKVRIRICQRLPTVCYPTRKRALYGACAALRRLARNPSVVPPPVSFGGRPRHRAGGEYRSLAQAPRDSIKARRRHPQTRRLGFSRSDGKPENRWSPRNRRSSTAQCSNAPRGHDAERSRDRNRRWDCRY